MDLSLLPDDKRTAPTRFELFNGRKYFKDVLRKRKRLIAQGQKECMKLLASEIIKGIPEDKLKILLNSKAMTRSMTANVKKLLSEIRIITRDLIMKLDMLNKVQDCDDPGEIPVIILRDVNKLRDRIMATKQLRDQVLRCLER
jgi:hypothetical protein